jgi:adenylylsulfate reductase, subunit A
MSAETIKKLEDIQVEVMETDFLIIGGGNAGCFAAYEAKTLNPALRVAIMEKAQISRSGALAAGMDAINTYIREDKGENAEKLVKWGRAQLGGGPIREDLALSNAELLNETVELLEEWGLPIVKDEDGYYKLRGRYDISIQGEQLKPILAEKAMEMGAQVLNRVVATNLLMDGERCAGAMGFGVRDGKFYVIKAKATLVATGGACGLYKSPVTDYSGAHHQTWMCPFNVGSGYAIGIRAGAEMTSFEQRWVAVRTKDFCGPVDTLSVAYGCLITNGKGEKIMEQRYAHVGGDKAPRFYRLNAPMNEWLEGRGPTYIDTTVLDEESSKDLREDMLNERPSFVLFLASLGIDITKEPVEIYGSDPYIVGGHTGSGYWVDGGRMSTVPGLFAAGETAGGSPNKFVGGCGAEGRLAARGALEYVKGMKPPTIDPDQTQREKERIFAPLLRGRDFDGVTPVEMEERMQRLMDEYAGGVHQFYRLNEERLTHALRHIRKLREQTRYLYGEDLHDLNSAHEVMDRLDVAEVLLHHLLFRKETRWPGWQTRMDYPEVDPNLDCFVESVRDPKTGEIKVFTRPYEQKIPGDRTKG